MANYFAGVDIGSTMTKVVIVGDGKEVLFDRTYRA